MFAGRGGVAVVSDTEVYVPKFVYIRLPLLADCFQEFLFLEQLFGFISSRNQACQVTVFEEINPPW